MQSESSTREKEYACITPTLELIGSENTLSRVLQSHTWKVTKAEPFGTDGFLTKIVCSDCGLERTGLLTNILESSKTAQKRRETDKELQKEKELFLEGFQNKVDF